MKKILSVLLCAAMITAACIVFSSCGKEDNTNAGGPDTGDTGKYEADGGWGKAESPKVPDEVKALFEKATAELDGAVYTPVAYLASQVVEGINHRVLCRVAPVVPDAVETYAIVTLYEDPSGNAEITDVMNSEAEAFFPTDAAGAWAEVDSPVLTDEAKDALTKACETLAGVEYTPVALLATQIVSGMNYRILCEACASVPDAVSYYTIVTVYADLDGNAQITETYEFDGEENTQIVNPVEEYGMDARSLEAAQEAVGFEIAFPEKFTAENFLVIDGTILEIDFDGGYIRKAKGGDDISGDFNEYEEVEAKDLDGREVTVKGNDGKIILAAWADGDYSYCIRIDKGVSEEEMTSYVNAVK